MHACMDRNADGAETALICAVNQFLSAKICVVSAPSAFLLQLHNLPRFLAAERGFKDD
jgi:hypothetical protein